MARGRAAFNGGQFFAAHEHWETVWRTLGAGAERTALQGLIQIAAGLHHLREGRSAPGARLLQKGADKLAAAPGGELAGLPLATLAAEVARTLAALRAATPAGNPDLSRLRL